MAQNETLKFLLQNLFGGTSASPTEEIEQERREDPRGPLGLGPKSQIVGALLSILRGHADLSPELMEKEAAGLRPKRSEGPTGVLPRDQFLEILIDLSTMAHGEGQTYERDLLNKRYETIQQGADISVEEFEKMLQLRNKLKALSTEKVPNRRKFQVDPNRFTSFSA